MSTLQVVDITALLEGDTSQERKISSEICKALESAGACYIKGHGISASFLDEFRDSSRRFFRQSNDVKEQYTRHRQKGDYIGWTIAGAEKLNPDRPGDLRELFDYKPSDITKSWEKWSTSLDKDFKTHCERFFNEGSKVAQRILRAITVGLGLEESNDIMRSHTFVGKAENTTEVRISYKIPVKDQGVKPDQARVGEHKDFGTFSLYFHENKSGFEIFSEAEQKFMVADPEEDACILLVGEMLQRYTADKLKAMKHRALFPKEIKTDEEMVDFVFYILADNDALVSPVDGSDKYPPKLAIDLLHKLMEAMWDDSKSTNTE